jgi:nitrite reductase (NADH) large subunit
MKYVIVGDGVAGITAAENIRKLDKDGDITIISDEAYPFYSRIRLIDYLAGTVDEEGLVLKDKSWYDLSNINLLLDDPAIDVDKENQEIICSSGKSMKYDKLLFSTGGVPFVPPIPGADKKNVYTLRKMKDGQKIFELTKNGGKKVVIIGGGVLGLEVGNSLLKVGNNITIVEFFSRLLPRQMDPDGAEVLKSQMEDMGFSFFLGATSQDIVGDDIVEALVLKDGTRIDCDMIIISAGIRPAADLPIKMGLEMDKGVLVNDKMETDTPGVYAAGDLIQHRDKIYGIWPASEKQGEIAGINMAGGNAEYKGTTMSNKLKVVGINLFSAGDIDADEKYRSIVYSNPENHVYKKLVLDNDRIIGTILYGDGMPHWHKIMKAIELKRDISNIMADLERWDLEKL